MDIFDDDFLNTSSSFVVKCNAGGESTFRVLFKHILCIGM